jgi:hypothetical protein
MSKLRNLPLNVSPGPVTMRSRHYMSWVGQLPGVVTMLTDAGQESRTTVHHIVKRGRGKKGPDWWAIPVAEDRHVHGARSIDKLGKDGFRQEWDLPPYEHLALQVLFRYLETEAYDEPIWSEPVIEPEPTCARSAATYFRLLGRLVARGRPARAWNWTPPNHTDDLDPETWPVSDAPRSQAALRSSSTIR